MDENGLLDAVGELLYPDVMNHLRTPECEQDGHEDGHACLDVPDTKAMHQLAEELTRRHGNPRTLAANGVVGPTVSRRSGLPLLTPFGERVVEMRAWSYGGRWVGCGMVRGDGGTTCPVVLVAERRLPALDELPTDASCVDKLVAVTGWDPHHRSEIDWAAAEARLGTSLPSDYKDLAERFGRGGFDDYLDVQTPGGIIETAELLSEWEKTHGNSQWGPYRPFPAPGGLLWWASTEHEQDFCWLTDDPDPDRWSILHRNDGPWGRYNGTTSEFVLHMLTDPEHPYSTANAFDAHWFEGYESPDAAQR
ncbi:SMI1/KNR4 family protein [Streptomyces wuyuanensis]|uniref:SMI1/KNR4 family protein n=1 Tax=Streptomyces wuyuanensis TaxID=1196353 RepID=UPI003687951E